MTELKTFKTNYLSMGLKLSLRFLIILILTIYIATIFIDNPTVVGVLIALICGWSIYSIVNRLKKIISITIGIDEKGIVYQTPTGKESMLWQEIQKMIHPSGIALPYFITAGQMDFFILYSDVQDHYLNMTNYGRKIEIPPTISNKNRLIKEIIKKANLKKKSFSHEPTWEKSNESVVSSDLDIGYVGKFFQWLLIILFVVVAVILILDYFTGFSDKLF